MKSRSAILEKPKLRRRRRRQIISIIFGLVIILFLFLILWVTNTESLMIRSVKVEGAVAVSPNVIKDLARDGLTGNYFFIFPKRHIFWYPQGELKQNILKQFTRLEQVEVNRTGLSQILIKVKERTPVVLVCAERCFFSDRTGLLYATAPTFSKPVYLIWDIGSSTPTLGGRLGEIGAFNFIELAVEYFNEVFAGRGLIGWEATQILPLGAGDYKIIFTEAETGKALPVLVANSEAPTSSARNLDLALRQILGTTTPHTLPNLQYLDLRFGKKVFYKL